MIRLLICDDSTEAREALRAMLADQPEVEIVGEAENGKEAIAQTLSLTPDVVLMDVAMPVLDGVTATRRIHELLPATRIVAFAGSEDRDVVTAMMEAGASAYCVKGAPLWELVREVTGASDPLLRLAQGLARSLTGGGMGAYVARELAELTGAAFAATYLAEPGVGLSLAGFAGQSASENLETPPGLVVRALAERDLVAADAHELAELYRTGAPCGEALAVPLLSDGELLGALLVAMPVNVRTEADRKVVSDVGNLAAAFLANERRYAHSYSEARRDSLTGLSNKRAFDEHLERMLAAAARRGAEVGLAIFDLDDFKRINDEEGHPVGDRVLREVANAVRRTLRAAEEVFRIGGEEFAFVAEGGFEAAANVAERMRMALLRQRRGHRLPSLSAGVAAFPRDAQTREELVQKADSALYVAKWSGKNRVVVYNGDLESSPQTPPPTRIARRSSELATRILVVDDDAALRLLLRTTFEVVDIEVEEAESAAAALRRIDAGWPDVVVLDVGMPDIDGLVLCRRLKASQATRDLPVVLLTGSDEVDEAVGYEAGADAVLHKPFSPLELLAVVERLAGGLYEGPFRDRSLQPPEEQILLYAQDLRQLLEVERGQRTLLQAAYRETVGALAAALESKDTGTREHSQRVQQYAIELTRRIEPALLQNPSLEYGFLLHDVGKIGIPDRVLQKPAALTPEERRLMETHAPLGAQMLGGVALLRGEGLKVVRGHHERWDGKGYPDGLAGTDIPLGARIFAVADSLDAMTSDRPYRRAGEWKDALQEIRHEARRQFDPDVVEALFDCEQDLLDVRRELTAA